MLAVLRSLRVCQSSDVSQLKLLLSLQHEFPRKSMVAVKKMSSIQLVNFAEKK